MSILIHYYDVYMSEIKKFGKIKEPEEVKIATDLYKNDNDKFNDFFEECVQHSTTYSHLNIKIIHGLFSTWWVSNNTSSTKIPDQKELIRAMKLRYDEEEYSKFKGFKVRVNLNSDSDIVGDDSDSKNY